MYITIALIIAFIAILTLSSYIVKVLLYPKTKEYNFTLQNEIDRGNFTKEYYEELEKKDVIVKSDYGYDIHGIWIPFEDSNKTIVIVHGYTYTLFGSIKYVPVFHKLGFNVLVYDQRYHGLSGGRNSTFGYREKDDLKSVFDYLKSRFSEDMIIGTHGESLGGATVLLHGAMDDRVDFVISDCAFMDMKVQVAYRLKVENRLPSFPFVQFASVINKFLAGSFYYQISPISVADKIKAPTMIIHGKSDVYTPYEQGLHLYDKLICSKRFYGAEGATHAKSIAVDGERYYEEVKAFLLENKII